MSESSPLLHVSSTSTWVVDQIENGVASIEVDGKTTITLPLGALPDGIKEGDVLNATITVDAAERVRRLAQSAAQLSKGGSGGQGNISL